ncbi:uncharacterized protein LOC124940325 [Impatiens glandulifera]|uniref:uncharacterized protein LOC124940325 n=1 Tax=Impatiens glandulifera TaxID=253017 RepID=UPI001FB0B51E|nr:uncharacterized protein LOC124940325 [Impatiens glandulifera]
MGIWDDLRSTAIKLTTGYPPPITDLPVTGAVRAKDPQKLNYYAWILNNISKFTVDSASNKPLKGVLGGGKEGLQDENPFRASDAYLMEKKLREEEMNQLEQQNEILSTQNKKKKVKEDPESIGLTMSESKRIFIRSRL